MNFDHVKVDLKTHRTEDGRDYTVINPKGFVPALLLNSGEILTENIAILSWISDLPALFGDFVRYRLLEALAYVSTEIHKSFKPYFTPGATEDAKASAGQTILKRLTFIAERLNQDYLLGAGFSADQEVELPGEGIGGNQRRQMSGCGARTGRTSPR